MPRISEIWRTRLILLALTVLSLLPVLLQTRLNASGIYDIRFVGGLHPLDLAVLQDIGRLSLISPGIFVCALLASTIRPTPGLSRLLLTISITLFLVYVTLFLWWAVVVIELRVPLHYTRA